MFEAQRIDALVKKVQFGGTDEVQEDKTPRKDAIIDLTLEVGLLDGDEIYNELERNFFPGLTEMIDISGGDLREYEVNLKLKTFPIQHLKVYSIEDRSTLLSTGGVMVKKSMKVKAKNGSATLLLYLEFKRSDTLDILKDLDQTLVKFSIGPIQSSMDAVFLAAAQSQGVILEEDISAENENGTETEEIVVSPEYDSDTKETNLGDDDNEQQEQELPKSESELDVKELKNGNVSYLGYEFEKGAPLLLHYADREDGETITDLIQWALKEMENAGIEGEGNKYPVIKKEHIEQIFFDERSPAPVFEDETQGESPFQTEGIPEMSPVASSQPLELDQVDFRLSSFTSQKFVDEFLPPEDATGAAALKRWEIGQIAAVMAFRRGNPGDKIRIKKDELEAAYLLYQDGHTVEDALRG